MATISRDNTVTSKAVADDFVAIVSQVMKRSSSPMVEFVERHDLTLTQFKLVFVIANHEEPVSIGHLAEVTGVSLPSAGRAVDGLVRQKLATRTEDPEDRRVKLVAATDLANEGIQKIYEQRTRTLCNYLDQLTPAQLTDLAVAIAPLSELTLACHPSKFETERR